MVPPLLSIRKPSLTPAPSFLTVCFPDSSAQALDGQSAHPPLLTLYAMPFHPFSGRLELAIIRANAVLLAPPARQNARKVNTSFVAACKL
jgi:hypothetical protein